MFSTDVLQKNVLKQVWFNDEGTGGGGLVEWSCLGWSLQRRPEVLVGKIGNDLFFCFQNTLNNFFVS